MRFYKKVLAKLLFIYGNIIIVRITKDMLSCDNE